MIKDSLYEYRSTWEKLIRAVSSSSEFWSAYQVKEYFSPESISEDLERLGSTEKWSPVPDEWWSATSYQRVKSYMIMQSDDDHEIWLINDSCFESGGEPYLVKYKDVNHFLDTYSSHKGERNTSFFDGGDLIFMNLQTKEVGMYHHSDYLINFNFGELV